MEINCNAIATAYTLHVFVCIYSMYDCTGETDQGPQEGYPVKVSKFMTLFYHIHILWLDFGKLTKLYNSTRPILFYCFSCMHMHMYVHT